MVEENLRWTDILTRLAGAAGKPRSVRTLPAGVVRAMFRLGGRVNALTGKQPGLTIEHLDGLFLRELFVDPPVHRSVDEAIRETAKA